LWGLLRSYESQNRRDAAIIFHNGPRKKKGRHAATVPCRHIITCCETCNNSLLDAVRADNRRLSGQPFHREFSQESQAGFAVPSLRYNPMLEKGTVVSWSYMKLQIASSFFRSSERPKNLSMNLACSESLLSQPCGSAWLCHPISVKAIGLSVCFPISE
jgi:hypothetical protein